MTHTPHLKLIFFVIFQTIGELEFQDGLSDLSLGSISSFFEPSYPVLKSNPSYRCALLTFKRNELSIELVIQLSIHLTMVLLSQSDYPMESGLQAIFKSKDSDIEKSSSALTVLILSVLWSFKTSALTSVKIKTESKNFLPLVPKLILAIRYFVVFLIRISSIVIYFAPFIGLLGFANHYQAKENF